MSTSSPADLAPLLVTSWDSTMYEFMSDQVLGISGLINLSNIVFLVAFSVRDVLKLRSARRPQAPHFGHHRRGADFAVLLFPGPKALAADLLGSGVYDRQRDSRGGDSFGAAAGSSQRSRRRTLPSRLQID